MKKNNNTSSIPQLHMSRFDESNYLLKIAPMSSLNYISKDCTTIKIKTHSNEIHISAHPPEIEYIMISLINGFSEDEKVQAISYYKLLQKFKRPKVV